MLGYNEIFELQQKEKWTVVYDEYGRAPYAYRGNQWVGYDDLQWVSSDTVVSDNCDDNKWQLIDRSIKEKADYIKTTGLGGAMVWSIESDDFTGKSGQKYPLINTLNRALRWERTSRHPERWPKTYKIYTFQFKILQYRR